ncbi:MAG: UDP-N-acetylglucosamine 2-epimerase (non-hydrolyzing) [Candidatus Aenigmarchaeota archaeon]|nr:UDP-N-acetylglucosamine 2-epimerase (non-hydrolyzing) [Candidatus Aenigmarchaeota archaeon]
MKKILFVFGTRPEAIKMAPLIKEFQKYPDKFEVTICVTAQHRQLLDQVLNFFDIKPNYDFNIMKKNQTLFDITTNILDKIHKTLDEVIPDIIFVQGDTTTTFIGALSGYYKKLKVAHIEAGLRSKNKYSPFPEEINRILAGHLSDYHFAPTKNAEKNLLNEGIKKNIFVVGNTVVDALLLGLNNLKEKKEREYIDYFKFIDFSKKIILVTGHRRESFGAPFENICCSLQELANKHKNIEIVYPVHLNPNVREPVMRILKDKSNVHLIEPLDYPYFIWLMNKCYLILTDSGGIQEEAPSLGKPVLVMREVTERIEGINAGTAKLVGTEKEKIIKETSILLTNNEEYKRMSKCTNPYGDGKTSKRIVKLLEHI